MQSFQRILPILLQIKFDGRSVFYFLPSVIMLDNCFPQDFLAIMVQAPNKFLTKEEFIAHM